MKNKILNRIQLKKKLVNLKKNKKKIILCHGVFDVLHLGHCRHFEKAKQFGDILIVGLYFGGSKIVDRFYFLRLSFIYK